VAESPALFHLRQALAAVEREQEGLPPFSVANRACLEDQEELRTMIRRRAL
jgi:hypothetical protein